MSKKICILGSTGSIGKQTIEIIRSCGFELTGISGNTNILELENQIREFSPKYCAVADQRLAEDLAVRVKDTPTVVLSGDDGVCQLANESGADILSNSLLGSCGIRPTLAAIDAHTDIAMANKEPIVAAGEIILSRAKDNGVRIIPVDSEHSAIFQCINGGFNSYKYVNRLILTASGGPFFGRQRIELKNVTPEIACAHPTWSMGKKISVDSATLMNKALELIEAVRLFGVSADRVEVTVHRQSIVHSMVEFCDSSTLAQLGHPDMKHCIQFALTYPERCESICRPMDYTKAFSLTFEPLDEKTFSFLPLARRCVAEGGSLPCVMNAANEAAVELFLSKKIGFCDIFSLVEDAVKGHNKENITDIDRLSEIDALIKEQVFNTAKS